MLFLFIHFGTNSASLGFVPLRLCASEALCLCAFAPLRLRASAPLRLCGFVPLRLCASSAPLRLVSTPRVCASARFVSLLFSLLVFLRCSSVSSALLVLLCLSSSGSALPLVSTQSINTTRADFTKGLLSTSVSDTPSFRAHPSISKIQDIQYILTFIYEYIAFPLKSSILYTVCISLQLVGRHRAILSAQCFWCSLSHYSLYYGCYRRRNIPQALIE